MTFELLNTWMTEQKGKRPSKVEDPDVTDLWLRAQLPPHCCYARCPHRCFFDGPRWLVSSVDTAGGVHPAAVIRRGTGSVEQSSCCLPLRYWWTFVHHPKMMFFFPPMMLLTKSSERYLRSGKVSRILQNSVGFLTKSAKMIMSSNPRLSLKFRQFRRDLQASI